MPVRVPRQTLDGDGVWLILVGKRLLRAEQLAHQRQSKAA